ncbi:hypothetical protein [Streptomyces scopuliridis]|uniref:hypothetical protein n=1 Tax=Streptomyces scopuliridis TaxID=452529 RepID=UPI0036AC33A9
MELIFAAVGSLLALLAIIAAYDIYLRQNKIKRLGYRIVTNSPLVSPDAGRLDRLRVAYDSRRLDDPRLVVLRLINSGGQEIRREDFQGDLRAVFDGGTRITSVVGVTTHPEGMSVPGVAQEDSELRVSPVTLNPGDFVDLQVLTEGPFTQIRVLGHVAGVQEIVGLPEHEGNGRGRLGASPYVLTFAILAVATLASVVWFMKVLFFPEVPPPASKPVAAQEFSLKIGEVVVADSEDGAGLLEEPGSVDVYRFTGRRDQRVFLERRDCGNSFPIEIELLRPNKGRIPNFQGSLRPGCPLLKPDPFLLPEDGTYTLRIDSPFGETPGTYGLTLWDSPSVRYKTDMRSTIADSVKAPGTQHIYTFDVKKGAIFRFDGETTGGLDIDWTLRGPDDSAIKEGSSYQDNKLSSQYPMELNVEGMYSLVIDANSATGSYTIRPRL